MVNDHLPFAIMHGSGNNFVMIDNREGIVTDPSALARAACPRGIGLGCDGVVILSADDPEVDVVWRYINADGTDGALCGNGAMCGARFAMDRGFGGEHLRIQTPAGVIRADVDPITHLVHVDMVDAICTDTDLPLGGNDISAPFARYIVGVPHVVAVVSDADAIPDLHAIGARIRHDPRLMPDGANINFISPIDTHTLRMRTYERGVEAETLACGTGSIASAVEAVRRGIAQQPVTVITTSGMPIRITWRQDGNTARDVTMTGEARYIAHGHIDPELFLPHTTST